MSAPLKTLNDEILLLGSTTTVRQAIEVNPMLIDQLVQDRVIRLSIPAWSALTTAKKRARAGGAK